jgi:hypothetical protein
MVLLFRNVLLCIFNIFGMGGERNCDAVNGVMMDGQCERTRQSGKQYAVA